MQCVFEHDLIKAVFHTVQRESIGCNIVCLKASRRNTNEVIIRLFTKEPVVEFVLKISFVAED